MTESAAFPTHSCHQKPCRIVFATSCTSVTLTRKLAHVTSHGAPGSANKNRTTKKNNVQRRRTWFRDAMIKGPAKTKMASDSRSDTRRTIATSTPTGTKGTLLLSFVLAFAPAAEAPASSDDAVLWLLFAPRGNVASSSAESLFLLRRCMK